MGMFLAVSAFQNVAPEDLARGIVEVCGRHGVTAEVAGRGSGADTPEQDAFVFAPRNRWTVVLWPDFFNNHDFPICQDLARGLDGFVSSAHVYDGDYWCHILLRKGDVLDRFASMPAYFAEDEEEIRRTADKYRGNAPTIARALGVSPEQINPYLVHRDPSDETAPGKAHPDDEFDLDDVWVFTDFWKRLGIVYPDAPDHYELRVRVAKDFGSRLPLEKDPEGIVL